MKRLLLILLGAALLAGYGWYDAYLFTAKLSDVQGNLEASIIWATPTAAVALWRFERRHRQREVAEQARHDEHVAYLDAIDAKVDQLHQHLGINPDAG